MEIPKMTMGGGEKTKHEILNIFYEGSFSYTIDPDKDYFVSVAQGYLNPLYSAAFCVISRGKIVESGGGPVPGGSGSPPTITLSANHLFIIPGGNSDAALRGVLYSVD